MKTQILEKLKTLEQQYDISILMAIESGSRAWGFPSPDSDYDVRFIYCHPTAWYLGIEDRKETIECMEGDLDLVGWDIRKSLKLMRKSNAALFEKLQSPIVYLERDRFRGKLLQLAPGYFSCRAGLHHYLSMALNYRQTCMESKEVRLKDYFYLMRTSLASLWIATHESMPPMEFQALLPLITDQALKQKIEALVLLKMEVIEKYLYAKDPEIDAYLDAVLSLCQARSADFQKHVDPVEPLNDFFHKTIKQL